MRYFLFLVLLSISQLFSLNLIHDASYQLFPRIIGNKSGFVSVGALFNPSSDGNLAVPISGGLFFSPNIEIGAGLKTNWINTDNHIPHGVAGLRYKLKNRWILNGDILFPLSSGNETGISLGVQKQSQYHKRFYTYLTGKLGFMQGLAMDDALMAFEVAYYPTLKIFSPIYLEMGIIASSQTKNFEDYLAIDIQPGVRVPVARGAILQATCTYGLAGKQKEDARFNLIMIRRF
jgi:hypothetical protein